MARKSKPAPEHLVSTRPQRSQCRHCGVEILACYVRGQPTRLDCCHLNALGEAVVLVAGGRTYEISAIGRGHAIARRAVMISAGLPEYGHVHPAHACGLDWGSAQYADGRHLFEAAYTGAAPTF